MLLAHHQCQFSFTDKILSDMTRALHLGHSKALVELDQLHAHHLHGRTGDQSDTPLPICTLGLVQRKPAVRQYNGLHTWLVHNHALSTLHDERRHANDSTLQHKTTMSSTSQGPAHCRNCGQNTEHRLPPSDMPAALPACLCLQTSDPSRVEG